MKTTSDVLDEVSRERGIDKKVLIKAIETTIFKAARKTFGETREFETRFNEQTGKVDLFQYMKTVENVLDSEREISLDEAKKHNLEAVLDEELGFQIFWDPNDENNALQQEKEFGDLLRIKKNRQSFGRIAIQAAKQTLVQCIRDAETDLVLKEFNDKTGQLVKGVIRRIERGDLIVDIGKTEAILPKREQVLSESYRFGSSIFVVIKEIIKDKNKAKIILSRTDSLLVERLFEQEIPEISHGYIKITKISRIPGVRSKIALYSRMDDIDPIQACTAERNSRLNAVSRELNGERFDLIMQSSDPVQFAVSAIFPGQVLNYSIDQERKTIKLIVPDNNVAMALGKNGTNVKLASGLIGWKLDVIAESDFNKIPVVNIYS